MLVSDKSQSNNFLFSVIIPTYNRASILPRAISSVLNQTYSRFELIIVNDGSIDNTEEVIKSYEDERIVYCKHPQNKGVIAAEKTGIHKAKGDFVALLGDDDELVPNALEIVSKKIDSLSLPDIKIFLFNCFDVEQKRLSGSGNPSEGIISYEDILCGMITGDYWYLTAKSLFEEVNMPCDRLWGGELIIWLQALKKSNAYYTPQILYNAYRKHDGERISIFQNRLKHISRIKLTHQSLIENFGNDLKTICEKTYGERLFTLAFWQILDEDKINGQINLKESISYRFNMKAIFFLVLTYFMTGKQIISILNSFIFVVGRVK